MKSKKQNIANNLIKNPVDLRSQKSRAKGQGQSLNSSLGAPLTAGYFGNRNPTPPGFMENTVVAPWNWQPNASEWNMDLGDFDFGASPVFPGIDVDPIAGPPEDQPGFGSGEYNPSEEYFGFNQPGLSWNTETLSWEYSAPGMTIGDNIIWGQGIDVDPVAGPTEDQPGFGEGWLPESGQCPMGFVMGPGQVCLPDVSGLGESQFWLDDSMYEFDPGAGFGEWGFSESWPEGGSEFTGWLDDLWNYQDPYSPGNWDADEFGMTIDPNNPYFNTSSIEEQAGIYACDQQGLGYNPITGQCFAYDTGNTVDPGGPVGPGGPSGATQTSGTGIHGGGWNPSGGEVNEFGWDYCELDNHCDDGEICVMGVCTNQGEA